MTERGGIGAEELRRLIAEGEGTRVEFKVGLPRAPRVARTLAAFANTRGGHLIVGVDDRGRVVGAAHAREVARELHAIAAEEVEPPLKLLVRAVTLEEHRVVVATVRVSDHGPHRVAGSGGAHELPVRIGSSTRAARGAALERLRSRRSGAGLSGLTELERAVLKWLATRGDAATTSTRERTAAAFARAHNIGAARARRAFVKLERAGYLIGEGEGARRSYARL